MSTTTTRRTTVKDDALTATDLFLAGALVALVAAMMHAPSILHALGLFR